MRPRGRASGGVGAGQPFARCAPGEHGHILRLQQKQALCEQYGLAGAVGQRRSLRPCRFWEVLMTAVTVPVPLPLPGPPAAPAAPVSTPFLEGLLPAGLRALPAAGLPGLAA